MSMCSTRFESPFFASIWCHCAIFYTEQQSLIAVKEIESTTKAIVLLRQKNQSTTKTSESASPLLSYTERKKISGNVLSTLGKGSGAKSPSTKNYPETKNSPDILPTFNMLILILIYMLTYAFFFKMKTKNKETIYTI